MSRLSTEFREYQLSSVCIILLANKLTLMTS